MIEKEKVINALKTVLDPDFNKDIVSMGMVDNLEIKDNTVSFDFVLTTIACPFKDKMKEQAIQAIKQSVGENVEVNVKLTSQKEKQRDRKMLPGVKNIIAVVSGKGGVGKSTVAANLAVSIAKLGASVGLLDADIYGPSVPIMFGLQDVQPEAYMEGEKTVIVPVEKYGIKTLSIGFFVDPDQALAWRGPLAGNYLTQLISDGDWGELDYLVIDMPPGTGDIHLTIVQNIPVTGVVIVTTPQEVALVDVRKAHTFFSTESINVPIIGIVENMSWFTPAELPDNKYFIFGNQGGKKYAEENGIFLLGQIPLVQSITQSGDVGKPVALDITSIEGAAFSEMSKNVVRQVAKRIISMKPTQVVKTND